MTEAPDVPAIAAEANGRMTPIYIGVLIVEALVLVALWALSAWFTVP